VPRPFRFALLVLIALLAVPAAAVKAAPRMPIGFFDDPSFRWATPAKVPVANLRAAQLANASIIHVLADWSQIAPTKPANPLNGSDPAYRLSDIDALMRAAPYYDFQVLITISGTPKWANGGQTPNHPPTNLATLTDFAHMLAARYNGLRPGLGAVTRWSVWNEPNLSLFLTPQFSGGKIVSPAEYVKLWTAAYAGIKAGNPRAEVAAGDTSARGHNHPTGGVSDSVAPATFAHLVAIADPKMPFVAWSEHPYPSTYVLGPSQQVAYPSVSLSNINKFGASLKAWFHRRVPIWITEWAEQTKPEVSFGVSYAQQAKDAVTALKLAQASPYVEMFVWFVFRDSSNKTWFSGLETATGVKKPAYATFAAAAQGIDGQSVAVAPGRPFLIKIDAPRVSYNNKPGSLISMNWRVYGNGGRKVEAYGSANAHLAPDQTLQFMVKFKPAKGATYLLAVDVHDRSRLHSKVNVALIPPP
jgi:hypothetical protein